MTLKFKKEDLFYIVNINKEDFYSKSPSLTALVLRHINLWRELPDVPIRIRLKDDLAVYLQKRVDNNSEAP
jgi:hypothetical protein